MPSCIIPLHHGTAMKPAWYVCLKIASFHGNCFYLNNYSLCHLRHEKRRRRAQAQIPYQQQSIHEKAPRPSKPSTTKTCPLNPPKTLLPPHSEQQQTNERCSSQPQFETLRLGKKTPKTQHPISGIVLKYFLSGNSFFSCSPSWQPEPSGSCQQGRSSSGVSSISSLFTALLRKKPIDAPVLRFGTLEGLGYSTNQPFLNTCQRSDLMPFSAHHTKR